jgi:hypothetical protein
MSASDPLAPGTASLVVRVLFILGGVPSRFLGGGWNKMACFWFPFTLFCTVLAASLDLYESTDGGTPPARLVSSVYFLSRVATLFALWSTHAMHGREISHDENSEVVVRYMAARFLGTIYPDSYSSVRRHPMNFAFRLLIPDPWHSKCLLVFAALMCSSKVMCSVLCGKVYWSLPQASIQTATAVIFVQSVSEVSLICTLVLILAAVQEALQKVRNCSVVLQVTDVDWSGVRPGYLRLVDDLRLHCSEAKWPTLLVSSALLASFLATGIDVWGLRDGRYGSDPLTLWAIIVTDFISFAGWSGILLLLLTRFVAVHDTMHQLFVSRARTWLMNATGSDVLTIQDRAQSVLSLVRNEPAGWFLGPDIVITQNFVRGFVFMAAGNGAVAFLKQCAFFLEKGA